MEGSLLLPSPASARRLSLTCKAEHVWNLLREALLALPPRELFPRGAATVTLHLQSLHDCGPLPRSLRHFRQAALRVCRGPGQETLALPLRSTRPAACTSWAIVPKGVKRHHVTTSGTQKRALRVS